MAELQNINITKIAENSGLNYDSSTGVLSTNTQDVTFGTLEFDEKYFSKTDNKISFNSDSLGEVYQTKKTFSADYFTDIENIISLDIEKVKTAIGTGSSSSPSSEEIQKINDRLDSIEESIKNLKLDVINATIDELKAALDGNKLKKLSVQEYATLTELDEDTIYFVK